MGNQKIMEWVLRIAVFGEFLGHGVFALQGKEAWIGWIQKITGVDAIVAGQLLLAIGIADLLVALIVLIRPISWVLLWAAFWGFFTALIRPIVGESFWDFVERFANAGAPLALYFLLKSKALTVNK
ncbi:MAG TPA: hypothetical protein VJ103_00920 [Candidatus Paceibacterota bacterium]|nr:hypothetical protein [Candidatus Paceibacterota bacterium]